MILIVSEFGRELTIIAESIVLETTKRTISVSFVCPIRKTLPVQLSQ